MSSATFGPASVAARSKRRWPVPPRHCAGIAGLGRYVGEGPGDVAAINKVIDVNISAINVTAQSRIACCQPPRARLAARGDLNACSIASSRTGRMTAYNRLQSGTAGGADAGVGPTRRPAIRSWHCARFHYHAYVRGTSPAVDELLKDSHFPKREGRPGVRRLRCYIENPLLNGDGSARRRHSPTGSPGFAGKGMTIETTGCPGFDERSWRQ